MPTVQRPRRSDQEARRQELLAQLEAIFLVEGFRDLTVDDLAARLRISKTTLYTVASTREQIVVAVMKRFFREAVTRIESAVAAADDPAERIAAYLHTVGREMQRRSAACYADMIAYQPTAELYRRNGQASSDRIRSLIQEGVDAGVFRDVHGHFVGEAVALLIEGIIDGRLLRRTGLSSPEAWEELSSFALSALTHGLPRSA